MAKKKKTTIADAVSSAVADLRRSVARAELAVVRAGNKAVKAIQDRVDAGRRKVAPKKKAVKKAAKKVAKKATKRSKRR